jgi:hypothetical protein
LGSSLLSNKVFQSPEDDDDNEMEDAAITMSNAELTSTRQKQHALNFELSLLSFSSSHPQLPRPPCPDGHG